MHVVDPSPFNWLYITYNTVEELVRVNPEGKIRPAAMRSFRWEDDRTLKVDVRRGERFPDGEPLTAATVKRSFDEQGRWVAPHPPGTHFNIDERATCEADGEHTVRIHLPEPDGLLLGKLRAMQHHEHALLGGGRVRLRPGRQRRGSLVSDRRSGPVGHRSVPPR